MNKIKKTLMPALGKYKNEAKAYTLLGIPMGWWTLFFVVAFFSALYFSFTNVSLKKLADRKSVV